MQKNRNKEVACLHGKMLPAWNSRQASLVEQLAAQRMIACRFHPRRLLVYRGIFEMDVDNPRDEIPLGKYEAHLYQCPKCGSIQERRVTTGKDSQEYFFCHHCQRSLPFKNEENFKEHVRKYHLPCPHCEKELGIFQPNLSMSHAVQVTRKLWKFVEQAEKAKQVIKNAESLST